MKTVLMIFCILLVMAMMAGCATMGTQQDGVDDPQIIIAEILARRIGAAVAAQDPDGVPQAIAFCDALMGLEDAEVGGMMVYGLQYVSAKYTDDPLLADDLISVLKLLGLDLAQPDVALDGNKLGLARATIAAFKTGLNSTGANY